MSRVQMLKELAEAREEGPGWAEKQAARVAAALSFAARAAAAKRELQAA